MSVVVPAGMIEDRIETNAFDRHASGNSGINFVAYVTHPRRTCVIVDAGFSNKNGALIMRIVFGEQIADMTVTRIGRNKHRAHMGRIRPLIVNVIVYADDIDAFFAPAQLRCRSAHKHIASVELTLMVSLGCGGIVGAGFLRNDVNHRIDVADLNVATDLAHFVNCGNTRQHKLTFDLVTTILRKWIENAGFSSRPGEKGNLVDGTDEKRFEIG